MFYEEDERPATGRRREEGEGATYSSPSRPSTASRDARANHARQLEARRKERSSIGMVVASENMPRPSTAVGSRPSTAASTSSSSLLSLSSEAPPSPTLQQHQQHHQQQQQQPQQQQHSTHSISATQSNSSSNLFSSSPSGSPRTTVSTPRNDYPRPSTAVSEVTESEKELLKRGISPSFDPNADKPLRPTLDLTDVKTFTLRPPPKGGMVQCRIVREKKSGLLTPHYYLFLEENSSFLLAARKRKKSKSANYLISLDKQDMARDGPNYMGKLRSNFVGTEFVVYDKGLSAKESKQQGQGQGQGHESNAEPRQELAAICYGSNVLGMKGPRKMTVLIPALRENSSRVPWRPSSSTDSLIARHQANDHSNLVSLHNKAPVWNEETRSYVLNFHNRVKQASVKNFQLVHPDDLDYIILQFGRVSEDVFTMDFQYPMCMLQAFAIALSSFDNKLACE